jgi:hypothetical protein
MALLWIDGFEGYGTTTSTAIESLLTRRYAMLSNTGHQYLASGRNGGYGHQGAGTSNSCALVTPALTTSPTLFVGLAVKWTGALGTGAGYAYCMLYDGSSQGIVFQPAGSEIAVYLGGNLLGTTSGAAISQGAWFYLEFKCYCSATAGVIELRVGGSTKLLLTGQNTLTADAYYDHVWVGSGGGGATLASYVIDDLYIADGTGTNNNYFLGCPTVSAIFPAADATSQWTPSAGTSHYSLVNENPADDSTTNVQTGTSGKIDTFTYSAPTAFTAVAGIQINTTCRQITDSANTLITPAISGGVTSNDAGQVVGSGSFIDYRRVLECDPATGLAWTPTSIVAAQIGVEVA